MITGKIEGKIDFIVPIGLNEEELRHCINDIIHYYVELEENGLNKDDTYGYYSRKRLVEKLRTLERIYFPHYDM